MGVLNAGAAEYKNITYTIEPIVGYTQEKKENPARTKGGLTYGARVIAGWKIISGEAEYTETKTEELLSSPPEEIDDKTQRARLGIRSAYSLGSKLDWYLRGGGELQKTHSVVTALSASTTTDSNWKGYPYVGTGVSVHLGDALSLTGSVTATMKDLNDFNKTEYSFTGGISIHVNAK